MAAPAAALHGDALGVDLRPRPQVVERPREHALGLGLADERGLAGPGHVECKGGDAAAQEHVAALDVVLLAAVERAIESSSGAGRTPLGSRSSPTISLPSNGMRTVSTGGSSRRAKPWNASSDAR